MKPLMSNVCRYVLYEDKLVIEGDDILIMLKKEGDRWILSGSDSSYISNKVDKILDQLVPYKA